MAVDVVRLESIRVQAAAEVVLISDDVQLPGLEFALLPEHVVPVFGVVAEPILVEFKPLVGELLFMHQHPIAVIHVGGEPLTVERHGLLEPARFLSEHIPPIRLVAAEPLAVEAELIVGEPLLE